MEYIESDAKARKGFSNRVWNALDDGGTIIIVHKNRAAEVVALPSELSPKK